MTSRTTNAISLIIGLAACLQSAPTRAVPYKSEPGSFAVRVKTGAWRDADRGGREVAWKLYLPGSASAPAPVVVWSHGGGGSRDGAEYLGRHLASHGYAAFHLQHPGSDVEALRAGGPAARAALARAVQEPAAAAGRYRDVAFAVERIDALNASGDLTGRFAVETMGMSGHSFGAITTLVAAGQYLPGFGQSLAVPRFAAAFAMSPSPPRESYGSAEEAFRSMLMPIFHLTGTRDASPMNDFEAEARKIPFETISNVDQYLLVLDGGTHMTFTGRTQIAGRVVTYPTLKRHHELIRMAAVAFWDCHLRDDPQACAWLEEGGLDEELGAEGTYEYEPAAPRASGPPPR